jgi:hypothetical protein
MESRRTMNKNVEWYGMGRIGVTAITFEQASINDLWLNPKPGVTGQAEVGLRGPTLFLSLFFEVMSWGESAAQESQGFIWSQPKSTMYTAGLKTGVNF